VYPSDDTKRHITLALNALQSGEASASDSLIEHVYGELRAMAARRAAQAASAETIRPTELVHEAFIKLVGNQHQQWDSRAHFFGAAARAMKNVLVDRARTRSREKYGGKIRHVAMSDSIASIERGEFDDDDTVLALDRALNDFEKVFARQSETVMLRFYAGQSASQIAELMDVDKRTVERDLAFARAWLRKAIQGDGESEEVTENPAD
jgi:RNA polymerase sigma factor (TIGR02999 family)